MRSAECGVRNDRRLLVPPIPDSRPPTPVTTILDQIVATKRQEVERAKVSLPLAELSVRLKDAPPVRDFFSSLAADGPIKLIAEIKKASPSKGIIRADFDPVAIARIYEAHGASCLSVL